ncbi:hypothetical protein P7K49_012266 [Saguinus oedipus]|uniref:Uncharacterized protein n=1 Tax=Saguinus oedipus TaxID=9490 RepID=A0ABQ9VT13_SAGOE|nr:hypothetical protein P7K49_012266 [Saguinus oedipus]
MEWSLINKETLGAPGEGCAPRGRGEGWSAQKTEDESWPEQSLPLTLLATEGTGPALCAREGEHCPLHPWYPVPSKRRKEGPAPSAPLRGPLPCPSCHGERVPALLTLPRAPALLSLAPGGMAPAVRAQRLACPGAEARRVTALASRSPPEQRQGRGGVGRG